MDHWSHLVSQRASAPPVAVPVAAGPVVSEPPAAPRRIEPTWPGLRTAATMLACTATVVMLLVTAAVQDRLQAQSSAADADDLSLPPAGLVVDDEAPPAVEVLNGACPGRSCGPSRAASTSRGY